MCIRDSRTVAHAGSWLWFWMLRFSCAEGQIGVSGCHSSLRSGVQWCPREHLFVVFSELEGLG
eukprot:3030319-Amphidinium_carterae.1